MSTNFEPGFYENIEFSDYLADPAANNSGLKLFAQSAAKYAYWRNNDRPGTPAQIEGSALHCAILEPKQFAKRFGKGPAPRVGSNGRTKWDKSNPKAIPLAQSSWDKVQGMSKAFGNTSCTIARELLSDGISELSIWWDDPGTGLRCKIRIDCLKDNSIIVDIKSTQAGSPTNFLREVRRWQYALQAAFYTRGLNSAYRAAGVNRVVEAFIFVCVENYEPYEISTYMLANSILQEANERIDESLVRYKECLEKDEWPGYPDEIIVLGDE